MKTSVWIAVACPATGRVLIARRGPTSRNAGQWNFFGGGLERGERPQQTARRELWEEAGLTVPVSCLVPLADAVGANKRNLLYGLAVSSEITPRLNIESDDCRWVRPSELEAHHLLHAPTSQMMPALQAWLEDLARQFLSVASPAEAENRPDAVEPTAEARERERAANADVRLGTSPRRRSGTATLPLSGWRQFLHRLRR